MSIEASSFVLGLYMGRGNGHPRLRGVEGSDNDNKSAERSYSWLYCVIVAGS